MSCSPERSRQQETMPLLTVPICFQPALNLKVYFLGFSKGLAPGAGSDHVWCFLLSYDVFSTASPAPTQISLPPDIMTHQACSLQVKVGGRMENFGY